MRSRSRRSSSIPQRGRLSGRPAAGRRASGAPWDIKNGGEDNGKRHWEIERHRMIDALDRGETIEQYLATIPVTR
jgi:hypothetical protein